MAAKGLTNRQIAQELFLTVKTIETHLHAACDKLTGRWSPTRGKQGARARTAGPARRPVTLALAERGACHAGGPGFESRRSR